MSAYFVAHWILRPVSSATYINSVRKTFKKWVPIEKDAYENDVLHFIQT